MKNLIKLLITIFLVFNITFVNAQNDYIHMNKYSTEEYEFNPYTLVYEVKPTTDKAIKKKYKKINKLYKKQKYNEIQNIEPNFLPALYSIYINNENKKNYNSAIIELKRIRNLYPNFNPKAINAKLVNDLYSSKQYNEAITEIKKLGINYPYYNYYLSDCYFNLGMYKEAMIYSKQVKSNDEMYVKAQEILFRCLYRQKNIKEAYIVAKRLIDIDSYNPKHYLRAVSCTTNNDEKLKYLYKARNLTNDSAAELEINTTIIVLEHQKIQNAVKSSKKFIETPNWVEIISPVASYGNDMYWIERQDKFFKSTNDCIKNYTGSELSACFTSVISKQNTLNQQLMQQEQMHQENMYRQAVLDQNERMINIQRIQSINQMQMNNNLQNINNNLQQQNFNLQNINNNLFYSRF